VGFDFRVSVCVRSVEGGTGALLCDDGDDQPRSQWRTVSHHSVVERAKGNEIEFGDDGDTLACDVRRATCDMLMSYISAT
jgi:hypothetical protein